MSPETCTLTVAMSSLAYFDGARVVTELRGGGPQPPEGRHGMFLVVCLSLGEDWRPQLGEAYCLLSSNRLTGVFECFAYFPESVAFGAFVETVRSGGGIMEECVGLDALEEGARALSRVVRASEEAGAVYRTFGECPTRLREAAQRLLETVDLTGEADAKPVVGEADAKLVVVKSEPVPDAAKAGPVAVKSEPVGDADVPHTQVLPASFIHDAVRAPAERRLRVAMAVIQERDEAYIELQDKHNQLKEEVEILMARNAEQVAMLAENAAWIAEQAAAISQHVAHIQALTEELDAKPTGRAGKRKL